MNRCFGKPINNWHIKWQVYVQRKQLSLNCVTLGFTSGLCFQGILLWRLSWPAGMWGPEQPLWHVSPGRCWPKPLPGWPSISLNNSGSHKEKQLWGLLLVISSFIEGSLILIVFRNFCPGSLFCFTACTSKSSFNNYYYITLGLQLTVI